MLILIIHFEVRFFISVMLNVYTPFPIFITLLGQGSFFLLKGVCLVLKGVFLVLKGVFLVLKGVFLVLKGVFLVLKGVFLVLMSNMVSWEVIQDLYFPFKAILSTLLFNIKIP